MRIIIFGIAVLFILTAGVFVFPEATPAFATMCSARDSSDLSCPVVLQEFRRIIDDVNIYVGGAYEITGAFTNSEAAKKAFEESRATYNKWAAEEDSYAPWKGSHSIENVSVGDESFLALTTYTSDIKPKDVKVDGQSVEVPGDGLLKKYSARLVFRADACKVMHIGAVDLEKNYSAFHYVETKDTLLFPQQPYVVHNLHPESDHGKQVLIDQLVLNGRKIADSVRDFCGGSTTKTPTPPAKNLPGPSPYAACAIKCLDGVDARYQCPLPSPVIDDNGVSVISLPDGSTRNFLPRDNECVDDRGKTQNACLFQCQATVGGEPVFDPMSEGQKIKVAGVASDDPLNEAAKYTDLLRRRPDLPSAEEDIKRMLGNYEAGKPMSVWDVKGEPEMQVPGSDEWVILNKGDAIPPGARIFTGMDDDLFVSLPGVYLVKVRSFTDITFSETGIPKALSKGELINHLDLRTGDVEVHVERGTYQGTMQVRTPQAVAGVRGTHFWVSYDEAKRLGAVGVYEGEVAVDDLFHGTRTLLTPANDKTPRVIIIPFTNSASVQDQDMGAAGSRSQAQERSNSGAWWLVVVLIFVLGGGVSVLHKTGKLKPILRKILALVQRDASKPL